MLIRPKYKVIISNEVDVFLSSLPSKVRDKAIYNANLVTLCKKDSDLFIEDKGNRDMGTAHSLWRNELSNPRILGYTRRRADTFDPRICQKDSQNAQEGDRESREYKERIL